MAQDIIYPSTADRNLDQHSNGYEYTVGAKPSLPDEHLRSPLTSKLYSESLSFKRQEVSLSAMTFLFQEMISYLHKESESVNEFEAKLSNYGESIGSRLLELLNLRSSVSPTSSSRTSTFLSSSSSVLSTQASSTTGNASTNRTSNTGTSTKTTAQKSSTSDSSSDRHRHQTQSLTSQITKMRRRDLRILDILQFVHGTLWSYLFNHVSDDLVKSSERDNEYMIIDNQQTLTQFISGLNNRVSCDYYICGIIRGFLTNAGFRCKVTAHSMPQGELEKERVVYLIQFDNQVLEREGIRFS